MVVFQNLLLLFLLSKFPAKFSRLSISSSKTVTLFAAARSWHRGLRALFPSSAGSWPSRLDRACRTARADVLDGRLQSSRQEAPAAPRQRSPSGPASPPPTPKAGGPGAHRDGAGSLPVHSRPEGTHCLWGSRLKRKGVSTWVAGSILAGGCGRTVRCCRPRPGPPPRDGRRSLHRQLLRLGTRKQKTPRTFPFSVG